jgi:hypothetical protein
MLVCYTHFPCTFTCTHIHLYMYMSEKTLTSLGSCYLLHVFLKSLNLELSCMYVVHVHVWSGRYKASSFPTWFRHNLFAQYIYSTWIASHIHMTLPFKLVVVCVRHSFLVRPPVGRSFSLFPMVFTQQSSIDYIMICCDSCIHAPLQTHMYMYIQHFVWLTSTSFSSTSFSSTILYLWGCG